MMVINLIDFETPAQRRYRERRANGLCTVCSSSSLPDRPYCEQHARTVKEAQQKKVQSRLALGLCRWCDKQSTNGTFCEEHYQKSTESRLRYRATEKAAKTLHDISAKRNVDRKAKGICTTCGKRPCREGKVKCWVCSDTDAKLNVERTAQRKAEGLCIYCATPVTFTVGRKRTSCDGCRKRHKGYDSRPSSRFSRARSQRGKKHGWSLSLEQYTQVISQPCFYCDMTDLTEQGVGLDRRDNTDGYHLHNVVSCCPICNMVRNDIFSVEEMKILGKVVREIKMARLTSKES